MDCAACRHKDVFCYTYPDHRDGHCYYFREAVKARDKVCRSCGSTKELTIHHLDPKTEDLSRMILLCRACHDRQHHQQSYNL